MSSSQRTNFPIFQRCSNHQPVENRWTTDGKPMENRWKIDGKSVENRWKEVVVEAGGDVVVEVKPLLNRWKIVAYVASGSHVYS